MKKISHATLEYPLVLRKVLNELVISVPDLGYWKTLSLPENEFQKNLIDLEDLFFHGILSEMKAAWVEIEEHRTTKKWVPSPSTFKRSLQKDEADFTLPAFTRELSKHMLISENTVRREISRGVIQCYQTEGGHRRIPFAELEIYLSKRRTKQELFSL